MSDYPAVHKWLLVRRKSDDEVIGIIETGHNPMPYDDHRKWALERVAVMNKRFGSQGWKWWPISQSEYETYRDLHGFEVIEV